MINPETIKPVSLKAEKIKSFLNIPPERWEALTQTIWDLPAYQEEQKRRMDEFYKREGLI